MFINHDRLPDWTDQVTTLSCDCWNVDKQTESCRWYFTRLKLGQVHAQHSLTQKHTQGGQNNKNLINNTDTKAMKKMLNTLPCIVVAHCLQCSHQWHAAAECWEPALIISHIFRYECLTPRSSPPAIHTTHSVTSHYCYTSSLTVSTLYIFSLIKTKQKCQTAALFCSNIIFV